MIRRHTSSMFIVYREITRNAVWFIIKQIPEGKDGNINRAVSFIWEAIKLYSGPEKDFSRLMD